MAELRITPEFIQAAAQSEGVRKVLAERRDRLARAAEALAASEDVEGEVSTSEGTRPKGRPYARVEFDNVDQEWGTSKTRRRRILGRAAGLR